ncbi:hypothetical protein FQZ97_460360 [compost metagenome]
MSVYALTHASEKALGMLVKLGGSETLLLQRAANDLRAGIHLAALGEKVEAVITIAGTTNSMTLQAGDSANAQHLADYVEAIANGTAETAQTSNASTFVEHALLPCWKCKGAAIGFDYCAPGPGTHFLHGAQCRHNDCQRIMGCESAVDAADRWNAIQAGADDDHVVEAADMVNHPPHYKGHPSGIECIEVTERLPFNLGNAFKYVFRHRCKNGREDLEKARWYLARELDRCERGGIAIGDLQACSALAGRIAAHESYPLGAALVAIASDQPAEAMHWLDQLHAG